MISLATSKTMTPFCKSREQKTTKTHKRLGQATQQSAYGKDERLF